MSSIFNFSYRKVGGLHFIKLGRFGCSFYVSRTHRAPRHQTLLEWAITLFSLSIRYMFLLFFTR